MTFSTFHLYYPNSCSSAREYIAKILFEDWLGINVELHVGGSDRWQLKGGDGRQLEMADIFFPNAEPHWLAPQSLSSSLWMHLEMDSNALNCRQIKKGKIPVIAEEPRIDFFGNTLRMGLDILGSAFVILSRYEEAVSPERDAWDRVPSRASIVARSGCLERPIVDEYVMLLRACMKRLWPSIDLPTPTIPRLILSHDVDTPFNHLFADLRMASRRFIGDLMKRRSPGLAIGRLAQWQKVKSGFHSVDPYNTFDWLMDCSEKHGLRSSFYFMAGNTNPAMDGNYDLAHPEIRNLLRRIHARGHEIGLHPSFETYRDSEALKGEFDYLRRVCEEENIRQEQWGSRQHCLRFDPLLTPALLDTAGFSYDTSLGFADWIGFRCGTCREYPLFDLMRCRPLRLIERPLVVMDQTLSDPAYMNLGRSAEAADRVRKLVQLCQKHNGNFTMLWHNSSLVSKTDRAFYVDLLETASSYGIN